MSNIKFNMDTQKQIRMLYTHTQTLPTPPHPDPPQTPTTTYPPHPPPPTPPKDTEL